jgi:hypothetical protein
VIQTGVVKGPNDPQPFFNPVPYIMPDAYGNPTETSELEEIMKEPEMAETIAQLFDAITDLNPTLWTQKKIAMELGEKILNGEIEMPPISGEESLKSNDAPHSAPSASESFENTDDATPLP